MAPLQPTLKRQLGYFPGNEFVDWSDDSDDEDFQPKLLCDLLNEHGVSCLDVHQRLPKLLSTIVSDKVIFDWVLHIRYDNDYWTVRKPLTIEPKMDLRKFKLCLIDVFHEQGLTLGDLDNKTYENIFIQVLTSTDDIYSIWGDLNDTKTGFTNQTCEWKIIFTYDTFLEKWSIKTN